MSCTSQSPPAPRPTPARQRRNPAVPPPPPRSRPAALATRTESHANPGSPGAGAGASLPRHWHQRECTVGSWVGATVRRGGDLRALPARQLPELRADRAADLLQQPGLYLRTKPAPQQVSSTAREQHRTRRFHRAAHARASSTRSRGRPQAVGRTARADTSIRKQNAGACGVHLVRGEEQTCPVSTGRGTRRVQLVRGG